MRLIIAMVALSAIGCANDNESRFIIAPMNTEAPMQIASGSSENGIHWSCRQETVSPLLVWIDCSFQPKSSYARVCIDVAYYNSHSGDLVVSSKPFCAGDTHYIAFRGKDRASLDIFCGPTLEDCTMLAGEVK